MAVFRLAPWVGFALIALARPAFAQTPCGEWSPGVFGSAGLADGFVLSLAEFDDGKGNALYIGGEFEAALGIAANRIVRWDGVAAAPLGGGMNDWVYALTTFDDGSGEALYAAGLFTQANGASTNRVAKWNGISWSPLGAGVSSGGVYALAVFDSGTGPALYAAGNFNNAGGAVRPNIARWTGAQWQSVGSGLNGAAQVLEVFDDGTGPALYAAGNFTQAGGVPASRIAKWNGTAWSALGTGLDDVALGLGVFDDGSGPALYVGGEFSTAGGIPAQSLARWDGSTWSAVGGGIDCGSGCFSGVDALTVFDDGGGPALFVGGDFGGAGGFAANGVAKWDGTSWSALGSGVGGSIDSVRALHSFDRGDGARLYVGGSFDQAGGQFANRLATWGPSGWASVGGGNGLHFPSGEALTVFDDGSGESLFVGGAFIYAGSLEVRAAAKWDGNGWTSLPGLQNNSVDDFLAFDFGGGPMLFAGGSFSDSGTFTPYGFSAWNGSTWTPLGDGFRHGQHAEGIDPDITSLALFDDGTGPAIYAGGDFIRAGGGVPAHHIARWDGVTWSALGSGLDKPVEALAVFDDGTGPALYAAGHFAMAGGVAAGRIARWDGASWSSLGSGLGNGLAAESLAVFDDGGGAALYAGGTFTTAGGAPANRIARWDGNSWSPLESGMPSAGNSVNALEPFHDASGPVLVVGGNFSTAGGVPARNIALWDGAAFSPLGGGLGERPEDFIAFDDGSGPALFATGSFTVAGDHVSKGIARWTTSSLPLRRGNVGTAAGGAPADVLFVNGSAGDPVYRGVTVAAGVPATLAIDRAPAFGSPGHYAVWILDGDPGTTQCFSEIYRKGPGPVVSLGFGPSCLPVTNTVAAGSCPCPLTFPAGRTSKGVGTTLAATVCVNSRPGFPKSPTTFQQVFPAGVFTVAGVVIDRASPNLPAAELSLTNWIVVTAE